MGKIENAIEKLNNDIQKHPQDQYRALVGEHLIDCITTEEIADKVLEEGKTLEAALKTILSNAKKIAVKEHLFNCINGEMAAENAKKEAVSGCVAIADEEVYKWAREYFGIEAMEVEKPKSANIAETKKKTLKLSLEDFL